MQLFFYTFILLKFLIGKKTYIINENFFNKMIQFNNLNEDIPYQLLKDKYDEAIEAGQKNVEAISISSFNKDTCEVDSRFVNIKYISNDEFIFFTNYNSPKALAFISHNQIAALFYWSSVNVQIRMKANIKRKTIELNQEHFFNRSQEKNALAISSNQSRPIASYGQVKENYKETLKNDDLKKCPKYWGGYSFIPYYFEFWEGHESRINKRECFNKINGVWKHLFLQP